MYALSLVFQFLASISLLRFVRAQGECEKDNGCRGPSRHQLHGMIRLREGWVQEHGPNLGREMHCTHPFDAVGEGAVVAAEVTAATLLFGSFLEIVRRDGCEKRPDREGTGQTASGPRRNHRKWMWSEGLDGREDQES